MPSSMATADVGYLQRVKDTVHTLMPDSMSLRFRVAGTVHYLDRELRGTFRFSVGVGADIGAWIPDTEATLIEDIVEATREIKLNRIPTWMAPGDIVTLGPATYHEVVLVDRDTNTVGIEGSANTGLAAPHPIFLYAKKCTQHGAMVNPTKVVLNCPVPILPGDEIIQVTIPGVLGAYALRDAVTVNEANPGQFEITLDSAIQDDPGDEAIWYLRANPAYISDTLIIPDDLRMTGPIYFDLNSQILVDTTRVRGERITLEMMNANELVLESFTDLRRNQFVSTFHILPSSFLFGRKLAGKLQYEEQGRVWVIAGERGYGSVLVDLPAPVNTPAIEWSVPVKASVDGTLRVRWRGGAWQNFALVGGVDSTVTVTLNTDESQQLEIVWAGAQSSYCAVGSWYPSTRRAWLFRYTHLAKLDGARWMSTGAIFKPALITFGDLRSPNLLTDSGLMLLEQR